ncbi:hypothetical protein CFOL_v3_35236 [Cephalotus follicularis]|uniref:Uncharacterized protein n=1 Tax=Cephalotus follicularis TaxID=3775 RepID=A0A1Q3DH75_CEPFO|nr:hypothetical protein CFOL_v3_35236 [Cephalotus follicularis]
MKAKRIDLKYQNLDDVQVYQISQLFQKTYPFIQPQQDESTSHCLILYTTYFTNIFPLHPSCLLTHSLESSKPSDSSISLSPSTITLQLYRYILHRWYISLVLPSLHMFRFYVIFFL